MSASTANHSSLSPNPPFASETPLARVTPPARPRADRDEAPKVRRKTSIFKIQVPELEPHWIETIDSATD